MTLRELLESSEPRRLFRFDYQFSVESDRCLKAGRWNLATSIPFVDIWRMIWREDRWVMTELSFRVTDLDRPIKLVDT